MSFMKHCVFVLWTSRVRCGTRLSAAEGSRSASRRAGPIIALALLLGWPSPGFGQSVFFDDFNRPDGPVGNGWSHSVVGHEFGLVIRSHTLSTDEVFFESGIYRPIDLSGPVTISATATHKNGFGGVPFAYSPTFLIGSDGTLDSGYGITFFRGDANFADSTVSLKLDGTVLVNLRSSFQFRESIDVMMTLSPDGSVSGSVSGDGNSFAFNFGPRALVSFPPR